MNRICVVAICMAAIVTGHVRRAEAIPAFLKEFMAKYVNDSGDKEFVDLATKTKCDICHTDVNDRKKRNAYGTELARLLKKADKDKPQKIQEALDKVGGMKSDPAKSDSPTWAELFKSHKLP